MTMLPKRMGLSTLPELRKYLLDYPDLPVVVYGGNYANECYCSVVSPRIGYVLNVETPYDSVLPEDGLFWDEEFFRDTITDVLIGEMDASKGEDRYLTVEQINQRVDKIADEYKPYWVKVILVEVDA